MGSKQHRRAVEKLTSDDVSFLFLRAEKYLESEYVCSQVSISPVHKPLILRKIFTNIKVIALITKTFLENRRKDVTITSATRRVV